MMQSGFLNEKDRKALTALARDGSSRCRVSRRANALVLLDKGWSCQQVADALLLDDDTIRGWRKLFEREIPITNLWLHVPWLLAREAVGLFEDTRWTPDGLENYIKKEYDIVAEIFDLASAAGCKMFYPFRGADIGPFHILS